MSLLSSDSIGLVSWSLPGKSPLEMAQMLNDMGMSKLQIDVELMLFKPEVWGDAPAIFEAHGIQIVSGMWSIRSGLIADDKWDENQTLAKSVAVLSQKMGVDSLTSHIGVLPEVGTEKYDQVIRRGGQLAQVLSDYGCHFLFETGPESSDRLISYFKAVTEAGYPELWINYDPANMLIYNTDDPALALEAFLPWIKQCHLKDAWAPTDKGSLGKEALLGTGDVDWTHFLSTLKQANYQGNLIIECESAGNIVEDVHASVSYMETFMMSKTAM